jgi:hypothetical protein
MVRLKPAVGSMIKQIKQIKQINDKGHPKVPRYIESNAVSLADGG